MSTGNLQVQSFAARESAAVAGVHITLTGEDEHAGCRRFVTDDQGQAVERCLPAPDKALSLDENNNIRPYSVWNITAEKKGYQTVHITGVQVFADQTAVALLEMLPIQRRGAPDPQARDFDIPPHSLYQAQDPSSQGTREICEPRVLEFPIIPQKITVHLGKPAASAKNVTVSFRRYIANVASSEVYPTWPDAALRANIHAQISLALNRIFTEWYPSKGYNYTITNSTSYDQYYVHDRTIFSVMEKITDEIFNTYVRRFGTIEPYYTEYCDGKQVTCKGMKQWGTVDRAREGKDALQILKYYYGSNIEIVRTNNIEAIPESYPGTPLRKGDTGKYVRILQRQLTRIVKDYPFMGQPGTDGIFGEKTRQTVIAFQKQFRLTPDGVVGRATWYKISYIYVSVKDLAELTSEGEKPTGSQETLTGSNYPGSPLRRGDRGNPVTQIQFWLDRLAEFTPELSGLSVDGIFGAGTERAVRDFQRLNGLTVDGVVGRVTWDAIYVQYQSLQNDTNQSSNGYPGRPLRNGSRGDSVRRAQFWLRIIATNYSTIPSLTVDGIFGAGTERSVRAFQREFGFTADGVIGPVTWEKLYQVYADVTNQLLSPNQRPGVYPGTPLRIGSTGRSVREAQYYLVLMAAYYDSIPRVVIDGIYGAATAQAVSAFQRLEGLNADGVIGPATWKALYDRSQILRADSGLIHVFDLLPWPGYVVSEGAEGREVAFVQYLLRYIAYFYESVNPPEKVDGIFGEKTRLAVESWQQEFQLPVTGDLDEFDWNGLVSTFSSLAAGGSEAITEAANTDYPETVTGIGSIGGSVMQLQQGLNQLAAFYCEPAYLAEDGIFGNETRTAVEAFQQSESMRVTGIVERESWDRLFFRIGPSGHCVDCQNQQTKGETNHG